MSFQFRRGLLSGVPITFLKNLHAPLLLVFSFVESVIAAFVLPFANCFAKFSSFFFNGIVYHGYLLEKNDFPMGDFKRRLLCKLRSIFGIGFERPLKKHLLVYWQRCRLSELLIPGQVDAVQRQHLLPIPAVKWKFGGDDLAQRPVDIGRFKRGHRRRSESGFHQRQPFTRDA